MDSIQVHKEHLWQMDATTFRRICSAIDKLPSDLDFEVSELWSERSGLLQVFKDQSLDSTSLVGKDGSQSSFAGSSTLNTSLSH